MSIQFPPITQANRDTALAIATQLDADCNRIRSMTELTDVARRQRLAVAYMASRSAMTALEAKSNGDYQATWQAAMTAAFGVADLASTPAEQTMVSMSYRESLDRTETLDDYLEGARLMQRAADTGDELLARAVAKRAWDQGGQLGGPAWGDVLNTFLATRPKASAAVATLTQLQAGGANLRNAFAFVLPIPVELGAMPEYAISALAAS